VNELYPIGDVARRTGLNVSAVRFYADEGIVPPSGFSEGGFRLYDVTAIARLELVRTLRDLGVCSTNVRREHDAEPQNSRRTDKSMTTGRPPTAVSAICRR